MADLISKVDSILDNLVTTVRGIVQSDGYNYTVGEADRAGDKIDLPELIPADKFPACYVLERVSSPGGFESRGVSGPQTLRRTLTAQVVGWVKLERGGKSGAIQRLTADIVKIVMGDRTRGGFAEMTEIGDVRWEFGRDEGDPFHRVIVDVRMDYRHARGDA